MNTTFPPLIETRLRKLIDEGMKNNLVQFDEYCYSVIDKINNSQSIVNLNTPDCSCGSFKEFMFPCSHLAACIKINNLDFNIFINEKYTVKNLKKTYMNKLKLIDTSLIKSDNCTLPPNITKKAGRPKKTRIHSRGEVDPENQLACSRCNKKGHNICTCKEKINNASLQDRNILNTSLNNSEIVLHTINPLNNGKIHKKRTVKCTNCGQAHYKLTICRHT